MFAGKYLTLFAAVVATLPSSPASAVTYYTGDGTAYSLSTISSGNCNFMSAIPTASTNFVAMNQAQWDNQGACGRCVEVSCTDSRCAATKNVKRTLQVLDRCPECKQGDLDLPPAIFKDLTGSNPSRYTIQWRFVDCPNPGTIKVCVKVGSGPYWLGIQPTNFLTGVKSVTVNGVATTMLNGAFYYIATSSTGIDLNAAKITITSIYGDVVSGTYKLVTNSCTDTKQQFKTSTSRLLEDGNVTAIMEDADF